MRYPLEIEIQPSRLALGLNAAIHLIAAFAFVRSAVHPLIVFFVLAVLGVSFRTAMRAEIGTKGRILVLDDNGELRIMEHRRVVYALPEATCVDFGWAVWIHWRGARVARPRRRTMRGAMMLLPDNLPADSWRGLRIWLRHKATMQVGGSDARSEDAMPSERLAGRDEATSVQAGMPR
ncbi:protein YgfX [Aromatoleum diolicum]|uniref:Toxin CptA n=1 Tax=Aromatoleum diolicum TaxID=75796 RepID=A0ABX1Q6V2_9RHOO|nr:protein YgfX [Aromatoleum diolicum]NMG74043.1 hypothetical protein [Aromatoleum diolicum]